MVQKIAKYQEEKRGRDEMKRVLPENEGNGQYSIRTMVQEEGLHFVKFEANTDDLKIMPTKQFIVGSLCIV